MSISERIESTIERWRIKWGGALGNFLANFMLGFATKLLDTIEDETRDEAMAHLNKLKEIPNLPPEFHTLIDRAGGPGMPQAVVAIIPFLLGGMVGFALGAAAPIARWSTYMVDKMVRSARLDPLAVITAWRRDPEKYVHLFDDLKDQGWSDERIEALKFYTLYYPAPADLVRWQAREVFEPTMITKYGLDSEFEVIDKAPFYKAGMTDEQILNYWRAHWEHASWMQVVEMLHRGLVTEEEVYDWFRLVEIPPFWRQLLIDTAYTWPTRVDVRRWWDMRTIDETELRRLYSGMGYRGVNLDNYIRWTKVYTDFPMMMTRFSNGWITEEDIRTWLRGLEIPEDRINQFIQEKTKPEKAARVATERDLTVTDIIMGIKKDKISRDEGIELIMDLGYDREEAEFKVDVRVSVAEGSPETFAEFKDLTTKYKKAIGKEVKPMPEELKKAAEEMVRVTGEIEALKRSIEEEQRGLIDEEAIPEAATKRLKKLQVSLHRAEAELSRVKTEYNSKLAEWRHGTIE